MKYKNIREEELKNKVGADWFRNFDTTEIIGNIDFSVFPVQDSLFGRTPLLWAEAKTGNYDISTMFVQLILTIGKARTFDKTLPPAFLGAFDFKKIAFVPYISIQDIFYLNDFNWNVTPSNHETKEFQLIKERVEATLKRSTYVYDYLEDEKELKFFIANNIAKATETAKIKIDKNNFIPIYLRWLEIIKPIIEVNWDELRKANILDSDFYLADLFVDDKDTQKIEDDTTIRDNLFVIYQNQGYKIAKENLKQMFDATISIRNKEMYQQFWKRYKRPPLKEYQEYIIERRDLLVPQDIRERKGAFFTPRQWVELSQKYLTDVFGENWQDEYYIWDCAAGTGNLLAGLSNKYNIYASTLDQADVNVMNERIEHGANLLKSHIFQFDFLNDEFLPISKGGKLPDSLFEIISNKEKRKKLVVYINPPYAEATTAKTVAGTSTNKENVSKGNKTHEKYRPLIKQAANEIFALFLIRIYKEIPLSKIANFSKLKNLQSSNFLYFRKLYRAKLEKFFQVPAKTFDNVKGEFPIGFFIWNGEIEENFIEIKSDVYNKEGIFIKEKTIASLDNIQRINKWIKIFDNKEFNPIGYMENPTPDFQNNKFLNISEIEGKRHNNYLYITGNNLVPASIYFAVRHCIPADWLNDRDQFLYPNDGWQSDTEFQNDCLAFTLFHGQNRISSQERTNHWIPFTEAEVNAKERFGSNFMTNFINGRIVSDNNQESSNQTKLFSEDQHKVYGLLPTTPLQFSDEATAVFDAGRQLWKYYHAQSDANVNASLYDIREYFQGRNEKGRMNSKSDDEKYTFLIGELREKLNILADKIKPKVFEYGFLRK
ncbi:hypothetical protein [Capnocytophaga cynodegmi]|uniref:Uncharacterized protein n=1 Tax=Capnocytophaga cynodegmi TaxID=28189 RepID=A0A0B7HE61_9FLAO|nr:hypothetical protein [Capnocytophaga cynodegmi]CEN37550.1 conserved hypothetical protein [Capnocytophaga cynodegmi]